MAGALLAADSSAALGDEGNRVMSILLMI